MSLFFFDCLVLLSKFYSRCILPGKRAFAVGDEAYYWSSFAGTAAGCYMHPPVSNMEHHGSPENGGPLEKEIPNIGHHHFQVNFGGVPSDNSQSC